MAPLLLARSNSGDASDILPVSTIVFIVGLSLAGLLIVIALLWIALRFFRHKSQAKREEERGVAFLNVRGVIREMNEPGPVHHILR